METKNHRTLLSVAKYETSPHKTSTVVGLGNAWLPSGLGDPGQLIAPRGQYRGTSVLLGAIFYKYTFVKTNSEGFMHLQSLTAKA